MAQAKKTTIQQSLGEKRGPVQSGKKKMVSGWAELTSEGEQTERENLRASPVRQKQRSNEKFVSTIRAASISILKKFLWNHIC